MEKNGQSTPQTGFDGSDLQSTSFSRRKDHLEQRGASLALPIHLKSRVRVSSRVLCETSVPS